MLYGGNGYTGELIARYASQYNLKPVLAGRRKTALEPLAQKLGLPYKVVDLNDAPGLEAALMDCALVLHAAGPFKDTSKQMVEACLLTGTHYLDINGDIQVFEMLKKYDAEAKARGIMILPGTGFDVVPTDCVSLWLHKKMPDATDLKLAFASLPGMISHGTATTIASKLGEGGAVRRNGKIAHTTLGKHGMWVDFGMKRLFVMSIPWGDVSTAHFTTGIPDIETYMAVKPSMYRILKLQFLFNWLLRTSAVRSYVKRKINKRPAGPTDSERSKGATMVWGQVTNRKGEKAIARLQAPDGYTLTAHASLLIMRKILEGNFKTGYQTPASAYGEDFIFEIPGTKSITGFEPIDR